MGRGGPRPSLPAGSPARSCGAPSGLTSALGWRTRSVQSGVRGLMGRACMSCLLRAAWPLPRGASGGEHGEVVWVAAARGVTHGPRWSEGRLRQARRARALVVCVERVPACRETADLSVCPGGEIAISSARKRGSHPTAGESTGESPSSGETHPTRVKCRVRLTRRVSGGTSPGG